MTISNDELKERLGFALRVGEEAQEFILGYYQSESLVVESKRDSSPVTAADRGAEELIRKRIDETSPDDGVLGEEHGEKESRNGFRWILDPVDGTKSFIHGVPLFGTLIGLEHEGRVVVGVCRFPASDEVVYAAEGEGTWWQVGDSAPRRTAVSAVGNLSDALFCTTTITGWKSAGAQAKYELLCEKAGLVRGWGDCYGHILVATGRADVMVDPAMNPWDIAALIPIIQEAGGFFGGWDGETSVNSPNGFSVNAALKDDVLSILSER